MKEGEGQRRGRRREMDKWQLCTSLSSTATSRAAVMPLLMDSGGFIHLTTPHPYTTLHCNAHTRLSLLLAGHE